MATKSLYVGNVSYSSTEESLLEAFGAHQPSNVRIIEGRGFAFIDVAADNLEAAIAEMNGKQVDGRTLTVNEARPVRAVVAEAAVAAAAVAATAAVVAAATAVAEAAVVTAAVAAEATVAAEAVAVAAAVAVMAEAVVAAAATVTDAAVAAAAATAAASERATKPIESLEAARRWFQLRAAFRCLR